MKVDGQLVHVSMVNKAPWRFEQNCAAFDLDCCVVLDAQKFQIDGYADMPLAMLTWSLHHLSKAHWDVVMVMAVLVEGIGLLQLELPLWSDHVQELNVLGTYPWTVPRTTPTRVAKNTAAVA